MGLGFGILGGIERGWFSRDQLEYDYERMVGFLEKEMLAWKSGTWLDGKLEK